MSEYYYLVASLPLLEFGMKAPVRYGDFFRLCREQLSVSDMEIIKRAKIIPSNVVEDSSPTLRQYKRYEVILRNEMAKVRALRRLKDPHKYIRGEIYTDPFISSFLRWITNIDSPLEAEIALDKARWVRLEELSKGHFFDIDYLITYALKLQILERWGMINSKPGAQALQELLEKEIK